MKVKDIFKKVRNVVTVRPLRKWISFKLKVNAYRELVREIEASFPDDAVLIFQNSFFDKDGTKCFNGGAERYVRDLADMVVESGKTPILIQHGDREVWARRVDNLCVIGLPIRDDRNLFNAVIGMFQKYDYVIYSCAYDFGKKIHPNIFISHGIWWDHPTNNLPREWHRGLLSGVDKMVSVDTNTISFYRTEYGKLAQHIRWNYIPNYVDLNEYKPAAKKKDGKKIHILFPRRAHEARGFFMTVNIADKILAGNKNVVFDFVGFLHTDEIKKSLGALMKKYPDNVTHSMLEPEEMPRAYQNADISLVPTLWSEGTSLSCLEAMACGNAVIATNIGGLPNLVIDGYNGLLINPYEDELLAAVEKLIADEKLRAKLSQNALALVPSFSKKIWQDKWREIIANQKSKRPGRLIAMTIVRNESKNYLEPWLENMRGIVDYHVFLDDASDDDTPKIIQAAIDAGYPGELHRRDTSLFMKNEPALRGELWEHVRKIAGPGDWILIADADEFYDERMTAFKERALQWDFEYDVCRISCCDMWDGEHYRVDGRWSPARSMTRLFRFKDIPFGAGAAELHQPPHPAGLNLENNYKTFLPMLHAAYLRPMDRKLRYHRYVKNAPNEVMKKHALSVLDVPPKLKKLKSKNNPIKELE
ncbi:MAG: glycosyltransferase [Alphaproteobacteria bacterium]|nr:glycosyltransferase [Alphaproteobacteria bacterium]